MAVLIQLEQVGKDLPEELESFSETLMKQHLKEETNVYIVREILNLASNFKCFGDDSIDKFIFAIVMKRLENLPLTQQHKAQVAGI